MLKIVKKSAFVALMSSMISLSACSINSNIPVNDVAIETNDENFIDAKELDSHTHDDTLDIPKIKEVDDDSEVTMIAVGDDLIHSSVYQAGKQKDGSYNFDSFFENIQYKLDEADIKVINQETVLVSDPKDYSGYPCFGSPYAVGDSIAKAGFNVVLEATNHSYDKGVSGIMDSLNFWEKYPEIKVLGIHENKKDASSITVMTVNNISIVMLNYTYGLNGFKLPSDKEYLVDTLYDKDKVVNDIKKAKQEADVVVVFTHWGTEYVYEETSYQKDYANIMAEAGADIIIGGHPHVVEPLKYIETSDNRTVPVYYSLGNFISSQDEYSRMLGGMAYITINKDDNKISIDTDLLPTVTHNEGYGKEYTAYMLEDYTSSKARKHRLSFTLDDLYTLWNKIVLDDNKVKTKVK